MRRVGFMLRAGGAVLAGVLAFIACARAEHERTGPQRLERIPSRVVRDTSSHAAPTRDRPPSGPARPGSRGQTPRRTQLPADGGGDQSAPRTIFFIGNSFTRQGPVPELVEALAHSVGFVTVRVESRAIDGQTLAGHRADDSAQGAPARLREGWDVVVLQEFSTRPTDRVGPALQFKEDATWFYDLAKAANPACVVLLYEPWARAGKGLQDFVGMQAELRRHTLDAAARYIPTHSRAARKGDIHVALVGDAWELELGSVAPPPLHAEDGHHASPAGQYLTALVLYSTIFGVRASGLPPLVVDPETAARLQRTANAITGGDGRGRAPERTPFREDRPQDWPGA